jgi:hypothetical protein
MPLNPLRCVRHVSQSRCDETVIYANSAEIENCDSFLLLEIKRVLLFFLPFKRPDEDENGESDQSFVETAGIVQGRIRIVGLNRPLMEKISQ